MSSFAEWNDRLRQHFFCEANAGTIVRLAVSRNLLDDEFEDLGGSEDFERAVRRGPAWPTGLRYNYENRHEFFTQKGLMDRVLGMHRAWDKPETKPDAYDFLADWGKWQFVPPPYLPYLCLFCYAWTLDEEDDEGEFLPGNAYFGRLEICYPGHGLTTLNWTGPLWEGLQTWANHERRGRAGLLGKFHPHALERARQFVGIAKAQVIFTAGRVRRFPAFFDALGLVAGHEYSAPEIRNRARLHPAVVRQYLGNALFEVLDKQGHPWQDEVSRQLQEHFDEWDGEIPEPSEGGGGGGRGYQPQSHEEKVGQLLLCLSPKNQNTEWNARVTVHCDAVPAGTLEVAHNGVTWCCRLGGVGYGLFNRKLPSGVVEYLSGETIANADQPWSTCASWVDEEIGTDRVRLVQVRGKIRFLLWDGPSLVERTNLPRSGVVYCLVHQTVAPAWNQWRTGPVQGLIQHIGGKGLPVGWTLWCITSVEQISPQLWERLPGQESRRLGIARVIRLNGGSRVHNDETARRCYLPFDLPRLVLDDADPTTQLMIEGGTLEAIVDGARQGWTANLPGRSLRVYFVRPAAGATLIRLQAIRHDTRLARLDFGISRISGAIGAVEGSAFRIDRFGSPAEAGAAGADIPEVVPVTPWIAPGQDGWYKQLGEDNISALELLEWIANFGRRIPYARIRDYLGVRNEYLNPAYEVKALVQLGHLDLETDTRGRWAYVHPLPCAMYSLPTLRDKRRQAVLTGSYTRDQLDRVRALAASGHLEFLHTAQLGGSDRRSYAFVPRQQLILADDLQHFRDIAQAAGIRWYDTPPALSLSRWAGKLDDWERASNWHRDPGFQSVHAYDPITYTTRDIVGRPAGLSLSLERATDRLTDRYFVYQLTRQQGNDVRYASVSHKAWGCWLVQREAWRAKLGRMDDPEPIPIPYDPADGILAFPLELEPPAILSRALVMCSGYAPSYTARDEYSTPQSRFVIGPAYAGMCVLYEFVPPVIARTILSKLGAYPVSLAD